MYRKEFIGILLAPMGVLAQRFVQTWPSAQHSSLFKHIKQIHQPLIVTAQLNLKLEVTNLLAGPPNRRTHKLGGRVQNSIFLMHMSEWGTNCELVSWIN